MALLAILTRTSTCDEGTFGHLDVAGQTFMTGELPYRDNERGKSCVPCGKYNAIWEHSARFGRQLYEIKGIPWRDEIKFHPANFMGDRAKRLKCELDGCIALGTSVGVLLGQKALIKSRAAMDRFEALLATQPFDLAIECGYLDQETR